MENGAYLGSVNGMTGKTTTEMKTKSTFTGGGWSFQDPGNNTVYWKIDNSSSINNGYPYFSWLN